MLKLSTYLGRPFCVPLVSMLSLGVIGSSPLPNHYVLPYDLAPEKRTP